VHELAITESILKIADKHAHDSDAVKVTTINIVIGRLSSVVDDSVQFYWDIISEQSICKGAKLNFERRPAILHCNSCVNDYEINSALQPCPACGSSNVFIKSGDEFFVDSIEIEK